MKTTALVALLGFALLACSASPLPAQSGGKRGKVVTAAEVFEQMVKDMKARREKEPWDKRRNAVNPYDMLDVPTEDWQGTPEGRFAHSIKIPNPVPEDSGYRPGMTQQEYFELLCKNEAGEFIFKTADNVEGIYQIRPRRIYSHGEWAHLYALEDPYGYWVREWEEVGFEIVQPDLYAYFEIHSSARRRYGLEHKVAKLYDDSLFAQSPAAATIARYSGFDNKNTRTMKLQYDSTSRARYGFTWRGIKRPMDRNMGIAGGELIVLDLQTNEVMGVRRGYNVWNGGWTGRMCPRYGYMGGQDKTAYFTPWFIAKVARPARWKEFFAEREKTRRIVGDPTEKRY